MSATASVTVDGVPGVEARGRQLHGRSDRSSTGPTRAGPVGHRALPGPPSQATRAHHRIPGARIVPLPASGHVPMNDNPALVANVILQTTSTNL